MLRRLPYRVQVPFGLSVAVLVTALLVTGVSARISTTNARAQTLATLERAVVLLVAQAKPLLAAEDTWRMFALLRDTAALVPERWQGMPAWRCSIPRGMCSLHPTRPVSPRHKVCSVRPGMGSRCRLRRTACALSV